MDYPTLRELIVAYENMTFEKFIELKSQWLQNMHLTWLIQGHLTEANALKMVELAENALTFNRVSKDDIDFVRMVQINERSIYELERSNQDAQNPNSACEVAWSYRFVNNVDDYAVVKVLSSFLEEPTFNTLRTKE